MALFLLQCPAAFSKQLPYNIVLSAPKANNKRTKRDPLITRRNAWLLIKISLVTDSCNLIVYRQLIYAVNFRNISSHFRLFYIFTAKHYHRGMEGKKLIRKPCNRKNILDSQVYLIIAVENILYLENFIFFKQFKKCSSVFFYN